MQTAGSMSVRQADEDIEEGEIDEAFWAREDEVEARRQLLWANAAPLVWGAAPAKPRAGFRVEGDVRWPIKDAVASVLRDEAGPATAVAQEPEHKKRKADVVEEASVESPAAEPEAEERRKKHKKEKKEKKEKKREKREREAEKERGERADEESE